MHRILIAPFAALALPAIVLAQPWDNPFNGDWTVSMDRKKVSDVEGTLSINGTSGTSNIVARSRKNPCVGKQYSVTVAEVSAEQMVLTVNRAATLAGCKDSTHTFKKVDDKTLQGELDDGRIATLTRK